MIKYKIYSAYRNDQGGKTMTIGSRIKQIRQEQNITQEQLADSLGITSKAVSQWECDRTAPDISQLPALARFFNVTTDKLLGVDITRKKEEIDTILEYNREHFTSKGMNQQSIDYLSGKLNEYPNSPEIMDALAASLYSLYFQSGELFDEHEKRKKAEEIIELCQRGIRFSCQDFNPCYFKQLLVYLYTYLGNRTKAQEIASSLPHIPTTCDMLYPRTLEGKEALRAWQALLLNLMWATSNVISRIRKCGNYSPDQQIDILHFKEKLVRLVTDDEPLHYLDLLFCNALSISKAHICAGNDDIALEEIEKAIGYAESYDAISFDSRYKPCWLSEIDNHKTYSIKHNEKTYYETLMDHLTVNQYFERYQGNEKFSLIVAAIRKHIEAKPI